MAKRYTEFEQLNMPQIAEDILTKWNEKQTFKESIAIRQGAKPFVFF